MSVEDVHKTTITELQRLSALAMDRALQECKKSLQEKLKGVDTRIDELKKEIEQRTLYSSSHRTWDELPKTGGSLQQAPRKIENEAPQFGGPYRSGMNCQLQAAR
jgi:hypothetical protein